MQITRIKIGGEKNLVGEAAAQCHENKELVIHIGTKDADCLDPVFGKLFVPVQSFYFRRKPPQVIILAPSLGMLWRSIFQLLAQVFRFIPTLLAAFVLNIRVRLVASWNHSI